MTFILTTPVSSGSGTATSIPSVHPVVPQTIPSNTTTPLDTVNTSAIAVKWLVTITNPSTNRIMLFEINSINKNNTSVAFNRFGEVGDRLNITVDVGLSGVNMVLNVTNHEPTNISVTALRIIAA